MNEKTCGIQSNTRKRKISHILDTSNNHATEYSLKKGFIQKKLNTNNTSVVGKHLKSTYELVADLAW